MMSNFFAQLDSVYKMYGYTVKKDGDFRIYEFKHGRYFGVDFVNSQCCKDFSSILDSYQSNGFAWRKQNYETVLEAELCLFRETFDVKGRKFAAKNKYDSFVKIQERSLPANGKYEYINGKYSLLEFKDEDLASFTDNPSDILVNKISDLFDNNKNNPLFVIIEAAAGFGKTCSAYELLKAINKEDVLPLYIELAKNREARIFKYILLDEIDRQFQALIPSKLAIHEIKTGRIPLIIDGFDELLTRETSLSEAQLRDAESMLTTIIELLEDRAKIIITSRKTAIFNSEDFFELMRSHKKSCTIARFSLEEPEVEDWISADKVSLFQEKSFPLKDIANPVLLSYIRNIESNKLSEMINQKNNLVEKYFEFLLSREKVRQNYTFSVEAQLEILKKLALLMSELEINSESKEFIRDLIREWNIDTFDNYIKESTATLRPTKDELSERFSNHALLDRKDNGEIGFINDFVYGYLMGLNFVEGDIRTNYPNNSFIKFITEDLVMLSISSYKVQSIECRNQLHNIINDINWGFNSEFDLYVDTNLLNCTKRIYRLGTIYEQTYHAVQFIEGEFHDYNFSNCKFYNCKFRKDMFINCTFANCKFYNCAWDENAGVRKTDISLLSFMGCWDNNDFANVDYNEDDSHDPLISISHISVEDVENAILALFYRDNGRVNQIRKLKQIKSELIDYDAKILNKAINSLQRKKCIILDGGVCFILKDGTMMHKKNNIL